MKNIYKVLTENLINERLDEIAFQDKKFRSADKKLDEDLQMYVKLPLTEGDAKVVEQVFDAYAAQSARYAELAYRQGIEDAVQLLKEMGVIQNDSPRKWAGKKIKF